MVQRAFLIWRDYNGITRQTVLTTVAGSAGIQAVLQPCSWAQIYQGVESAIAGPLGVPVAEPYQSVKTSVQLTFQTAAGSILKVTIPAPILSSGGVPTGFFLADDMTVDPTNAFASALISACIGSLSDAAGNTAAVYIGGTFQPGRSDLPNQVP